MWWRRFRRRRCDKDGMAQKPVRIVKVTIEKKKVEPFLDATPEELRKTVSAEDHARHDPDPDGAGLGARTMCAIS